MKAMQMMSALAQPTRWSVYRLLVDELPGGKTAGEIAEAVGMSRNGMSPHFTILEAAGLLSSERSGRTITYRAETAPVETLSDFLARAVEKGRKARG